ncbi:MAG: universal stress protein, partial [Planctomycetaceae bacterium]|nr:universal stress protein [Planctomycetaceae bacterium]
MAVIQRIVVGVEMPQTHPWDAANLSAPSAIALRQAFSLAESLGIPIHLISVLDKHSAGLFGSAERAGQLEQTEHREAEAVLAELVEKHRARATRDVTVTSEVVTGKPFHRILQAAGNDRRTLIICGTRDRNAVSQMLFGSTGKKLLRSAAGPVWLVKPRIDDDPQLDLLAATDLTEVGEDVLQTAVALGRSLPARLNVITVVDENLRHRMARVGASDEELEEYRRSSLADAEDKLHQQLSLTDYRTLKAGVKTH